MQCIGIRIFYTETIYTTREASLSFIIKLHYLGNDMSFKTIEYGIEHALHIYLGVDLLLSQSILYP